MTDSIKPGNPRHSHAPLRAWLCVLLGFNVMAHGMPVAPTDSTAVKFGKFRAAGTTTLAELEAQLAKTPRMPVPVQASVILTTGNNDGRLAAVSARLHSLNGVKFRDEEHPASLEKLLALPIFASSKPGLNFLQVNLTPGFSIAETRTKALEELPAKFGTLTGNSPIRMPALNEMVERKVCSRILLQVCLTSSTSTASFISAPFILSSRNRTIPKLESPELRPGASTHRELSALPVFLNAVPGSVIRPIREATTLKYPLFAGGFYASSSIDLFLGAPAKREIRSIDLTTDSYPAFSLLPIFLTSTEIPSPQRNRAVPTVSLPNGDGHPSPPILSELTTTCELTQARKYITSLSELAAPGVIIRYPGNMRTATLHPLPPLRRNVIAFANPIAAFRAAMQSGALDETLRTGTLDEVMRRPIKTADDRNRLAWVIRTSPFSREAYECFDLIMSLSTASSRSAKIADTHKWASTLGSNTAAAVDYHAIYHLYRERDYDAVLLCVADYRATHTESLDRATLLEAMSFVNKKSLDKAVTSLQGIKESFPNSPLVPQSRFLIGWIYHSKQCPAEAETTLKELIRDYPKSEYAASAKDLIETLHR